MKILSKRERTRRAGATILRTLVSLVLLVLLFSRVNWEEFFQVLEGLNLVYLLFIIVLFYLSIGLSTYKWRAILIYLSIREKLSRLIAIYMIGVYVSNFLPTTVGGDSYRFIRLRSDHPDASDRILSSMVLERGYGFLTLLIANLVLLVVYWQTLQTSQLLFEIEVLIAIGVVALTLLALFGRGVLVRLTAWKSIFNPMVRFADLLAVRDLRTVFVAVVTSLVFVLTTGVSLGLYYRAAGEPISWVYALYVTTVLGIIGIVPLTINGLGLVELIQTLLLGLVGVPLEIVLAVSVLQRVMRLLLSLPGAALYFGGSMRVTQRLDETNDGS
jgi:glycosyltransferase 2 family protein